MGVLRIGGVLNAEQLQSVQRAAADLNWRDGAETAGTMARKVKRNEQADWSSPGGATVHASLEAALKANIVMKSAARPRRMSRLILSRTHAGGGYGAHVDNALMGGGKQRLRSDLSFTLFLSEPKAYDGGELILDLAVGRQTIKLAAGDLILYPSTEIHRVAPVTSGERLVCVGWIESEVRDPAQRAILFDIDNLRAGLSKASPDALDQRLLLDKVASNLLRMWAAP